MHFQEFFGMTISSLATKGSVAPEHRTSSVLTAIRCFVADVDNEAGLGIVVFLAAAKIMEKMVSKEEVMPGRTVGCT